MLIQWCLKGIPESKSFTDAAAKTVVDYTGISSSWLRHPVPAIASFVSDAHLALSQTALDAHVNGFASVAAKTPYISLSAGCRELDPTNTSTISYTALETALSFATNSGTCAGYVFLLWVIVSPKAAPELPGFAEEIRELNIFDQYAVFHDEGEIAAKLFIPARQIQSVEKYGADLVVKWTEVNNKFVPPERISNVLELI
jgi:hypothetical protein